MKQSVRQKVFDKYGGKCAYCGCDLPTRWHIDHANALHRNSFWCKERKKFITDGTCNHPENENFENYMPSCPSCNISKSTLSIEDFREWIQDGVRRLNDNHYNAYKFGKRFGLIKETGATVKFYFETI